MFIKLTQLTPKSPLLGQTSRILELSYTPSLMHIGLYGESRHYSGSNMPGAKSRLDSGVYSR